MEAAQDARLWAFSFLVVVTAAFLVLTYATGFGNSNTAKMMTEWGIAYGQVLLLIEPIQILALAALPFLVAEGSCAGRCVARVKTFYNNILAP